VPDVLSLDELHSTALDYRRARARTKMLLRGRAVTKTLLRALSQRRFYVRVLSQIHFYVGAPL
jgi:hypothetical protein